MSPKKSLVNSSPLLQDQPALPNAEEKFSQVDPTWQAEAQYTSPCTQLESSPSGPIQSQETTINPNEALLPVDNTPQINSRDDSGSKHLSTNDERVWFDSHPSWLDVDNEI
jgi:hypothetical protein